MMAVVEHHQVAVRSGHKIGKSLLLAILAIWWAVCWPQGKVLITAPTAPQIRDIVWAELRKLVARANAHGVIQVPEPSLRPDGGVRWDDGRVILGRSTDKAERIQGYSGPANLYLIDEASGVARGIFEALEGNTAGGAENDDSAVAKFVLTGNPTQTSGVFFDAFHKQRSFWRCFRISSADTPNAKQGKILIPGLATADYVAKKRQQWGEDSDLYRVRVHGDFPKQGDKAVVPLSLVEAGQGREVTEQGDLEIGVDVARYGDDDSAIAPRRGQRLYPLRVVHGMDEVEVAGAVIDLIKAMLQPGELRAKVKVDVTGVGGGVASILRRDERCDVVECHFAEASDDPDEYPNLRSQIWFAIADYLAEGGALPDDDELAGELVAPIYTFDARGRRVVEEKADIKKRLGRSPDRGDAVALAIYSPDTDTTVYRVPGRYSRR